MKHYLKDKQKNKKHDTGKIYSFIPIEFSVAIQQEDGGPQTHGVIVGKGHHNHDNR